MSENLMAPSDVTKAAAMLRQIDQLKEAADRAGEITEVQINRQLLDALETAAVRNALVTLRLNQMDDLITGLPNGVYRGGLQAGLRTLRIKLLGEQSPGAQRKDAA